MFNSRKVRHKYVLAMIDNSKRPVHPLKSDLGQGKSMHYFGLTKREYFAGLAMQGYCGGEFTGQSGMSHEIIAEWSVKMADALLKQLEQ